MQSVEMIPFGLLAGFVDEKEVRITEISTESFCFRVRELTNLNSNDVFPEPFFPVNNKCWRLVVSNSIVIFDK